MSASTAFNVARDIGGNFGQSFKRTSDESAIENILAEASASGDPEVLQNSIGQILARVSPERQGAAVQFLQNTMKNVEAKQIEQKSNARCSSSQFSSFPTFHLGIWPQIQLWLADLFLACLADEFHALLRPCVLVHCIASNVSSLGLASAFGLLKTSQVGLLSSYSKLTLSKLVG